VHTPEREHRTPNHARRLAATASLAAATFVGVTGLSLAVESTPAEASSNTSATPTITPVATLKSNYSSVTAGKPVTFTVTERTPLGAAVPSTRAAFYVHTVHGWQKVSTKTLSSSGLAKFTFHPNYAHAYRVDLSGVTADGVTKYKAVDTNDVTVKVKKADIGTRIVAAAAKHKGAPYRYGADGPHSFDCSGLVKYVFHGFGINLPHQANAQMKHGTRVSKADAKPGDLVFVLSGSHAYHVAIYAGDGTWWEAPHSGASVRHVKIWSTHIEFRRVR
jgi:peptidoglycan DL-endopeptidase CwlO